MSVLGKALESALDDWPAIWNYELFSHYKEYHRCHQFLPHISSVAHDLLLQNKPGSLTPRQPPNLKCPYGEILFETEVTAPSPKIAL